MKPALPGAVVNLLELLFYLNLHEIIHGGFQLRTLRVSSVTTSVLTRGQLSTVSPFLAWETAIECNCAFLFCLRITRVPVFVEHTW